MTQTMGTTVGPRNRATAGRKSATGCSVLPVVAAVEWLLTDSIRQEYPVIGVSRHVLWKSTPGVTLRVLAVHG